MIPTTPATVNSQSIQAINMVEPLKATLVVALFVATQAKHAVVLLDLLYPVFPILNEPVAPVTASMPVLRYAHQVAQELGIRNANKTIVAMLI
jgi:hypothetical protein